MSTLAGFHRDVIEKQEQLKGLAQDIVNRLSFSSGSFFPISDKAAGLKNPISENVEGQKNVETNQPVTSTASPEPAPIAKSAILSVTNGAVAAISPYQHGVHPATLDRISFSLGGGQLEDDFEL